MQTQIFKYPPLSVFIALFVGMLAAARGRGPEFVSGSAILVGLACAVGLLRMPPLPGHVMHRRRRLTDAVPSVLWPLLLISWLGIFRFQASLQDPGGQEFAAVSGSTVSVFVKVGSVSRRDGDQVRAVASVIRTGTPGIGLNKNAVITISCRSDRNGTRASVFCDDVVSGALLAVRGHVSYSSATGAVIYVPDRSSILPIVDSPRHSRSGFDAFRADLAARCGRSLKGYSAWLVPALVLGEGRGVPGAMWTSLSAIGTAHVISVSGLHVAAAAAAVGVLVFILVGIPAARFAPRVNVVKVAGVAAIGAAWTVSTLAGNPAPAIRSAGMATMYILCQWAVRRVPGEAVMAAVGICDLIAFPQDVTSLSFQLSYVAYFGMIVFIRAFPARGDKPDNAVGKLWRVIRASLIVSAGSSLAAMPLSVVTFGSAPLVGPLVNLLILPVFSFVIFSGAFVVSLFLLLSPDLSRWGGTLHIPVDVYSRIVDVTMDFQLRLGRWLPGELVFPTFPFNCLIASISLGFFVWVACGRNRTAVVVAVVAAMCVIVVPDWKVPDRGNGGVVFLDVGKGDATLIRCPSGQNWLVDASVRATGFDQMMSGLMKAGVRRIEGVVITHEHDDHFGGLPILIDAFGPFQIVATKRTLEATKTILEPDLADGGTVRPVTEGDQALEGCGIDSTVLFAGHSAISSQKDPTESDRGDDPNNNSLVFRLGPPESGVLFAGDLEEDGEKALIARGVDLRAAVLKVGHHGSPGASSPDFLKKVSPRAAVITGWPNGPRKGPSAAVLSRFGEVGSKVFSTTVQGDVEYRFEDPANIKNSANPVLKPRNGFLGGFEGRNALGRMLGISLGNLGSP